MKRTNLSNIQNLVEAELMLKPTFKTLPVVITKLVACSHETIKLFNLIQQQYLKLLSVYSMSLAEEIKTIYKLYIQIKYILCNIKFILL
jgi:hypothetical protein